MADTPVETQLGQAPEQFCAQNGETDVKITQAFLQQGGGHPLGNAFMTMLETKSAQGDSNAIAAVSAIDGAKTATVDGYEVNEDASSAYVAGTLLSGCMLGNTKDASGNMMTEKGQGVLDALYGINDPKDRQVTTTSDVCQTMSQVYYDAKNGQNVNQICAFEPARFQALNLDNTTYDQYYTKSSDGSVMAQTRSGNISGSGYYSGESM